MGQSTRETIFKTISEERDFQERLKADDTRPDIISDFHIGDTLSAIQHNLELARSFWYNGSAPHTDTTKYLRKIAALCVQAGENYGMPRRGTLTFNGENGIKTINT